MTDDALAYTGKTNKLAKARAGVSGTNYNNNHFSNDAVYNMPSSFTIPGLAVTNDYHRIIKIIRKFYKFDSIAGPVIDRMADMAMTKLKNRKNVPRNAGKVEDTVMAYYDAVAEKLTPVLRTFALEYLLHGMVVSGYTFEKIRGNLLSEKLGRTRYTFPKNVWVRNPDNIELKRKDTGIDRAVYIRVPEDHINAIKTEYISNNIVNPAYQYMVDNYPDYYIEAVKAGEKKVQLTDVRMIARKLNSYDPYPKPYLSNAVSALQHRESLKAMDRAIINRAIEAIRLIKVGDKDFPAIDEDLIEIEKLVNSHNSNGERVFNLITGHTTTIEWVIPPLEALLNEAKYVEATADIFLGLGFPRIFISGETLRSNSSDASIASMGPKSTLEDMRTAIIEWIRELYRELAEINGFTRIPEPYFMPVAIVDYTALVQFARDAYKSAAISRDTYAQLWGSDYDTESEQIASEREDDIASEDMLLKQQEQEFQMEMKDKEIEAADKARKETLKSQEQQTKNQPKQSINGAGNKPAANNMNNRNK